MNQKTQYYQNFPDTPQNRAAVVELIELIEPHYPEATFEVAAAPEESQVVHLYVTIDRVDTDELVDLVIEREMALQEEGVPIHVIPLRTPERDAEVRDQVAKERGHTPLS